jgi:hypothetical protein
MFTQNSNSLYIDIVHFFLFLLKLSVFYRPFWCGCRNEKEKMNYHGVCFHQESALLAFHLPVECEAIRRTKSHGHYNWQKIIYYNFLMKTNSAIKIREDVNIEVANSEYSFWSLSNTSELLIWIKFMFVNSGRKLVIICNRTFWQPIKRRFTLVNREFCRNFCRKAMTDSS